MEYVNQNTMNGGTTFLLKIKDKLILIRGNCDSRVDEFVLGVKFKDIDEIEKVFDRETPKKPILSDTWKDEEQTDIYDENVFIDPIVSICPNCRKYGIFDFEYGEKFNY